MAGIKRILSTVFGLGAYVGAKALKRTTAEHRRARAVTEHHRAEQAGVAEAHDDALSRASAAGFPERGRKGGGAAAVLAPPSGAATRPAPARQVDATVPKPASAPGAERVHHDVSGLHGPFAYLKELFGRFNGDHCPAWAAALSFFAILSFFPVLICGIALLGFLIRDPNAAADQVQRFVANLLPGAGAGSTANTIIQQANIRERAADLMKISGWASLVGILSLFWTASRIFVNAATPMNAAFEVKESRGFVKMQLYAIGMLFGVGALFLLSFLPTSGPHLLRAIPFLSGLPDPSPAWLDIVFVLLGVTINALMYTVIYKFLPSPSAGINWKEAAFAGSIVAVLWEAAKQGFAFYLRNFGEKGYDKVYGSLGGIIILVLWVYYSSMILLLGAEIAKLYSDAQDAKRRSEEGSASASRPAAA
jgi:membrane protein